MGKKDEEGNGKNKEGTGEDEERPSHLEKNGETWDHVTKGGLTMLKGIENESQAIEIEDAYYQGYRRGKRDERNRIMEIIEEGHHKTKKKI